jgi:sugar phosphate permease
VSLTVSAVDRIAENESGLASGLINTSQQIGGALGLAVLTAVATGRTENVAGEVGPAVALNEGFQAALLVAGGIVVAAVVLTAVFARGSRPNPTHGRRTAEETAAEPEPARA